MKICVGAIGISGFLIVTSASCGFKSDLYLPGQQQKIEQYDSRSLKDLGDEKLRQLQNQNDDSESSVFSNGQDSDDVTSNDGATGRSTEAVPVLPRNGVAVELPTDAEIERDKAKNLKKDTSENTTL